MRCRHISYVAAEKLLEHEDAGCLSAWFVLEMGRAITSMKKTAGETAERLAEYAVIHLGKCWNHGIKSFRRRSCFWGISYESRNSCRMPLFFGNLYNFTNGSCWNLYKNFEYVLTFLWEYSIIVLIPLGAFHVLWKIRECIELYFIGKGMRPSQGLAYEKEGGKQWKAKIYQQKNLLK